MKSEQQIREALSLFKGAINMAVRNGRASDLEYEFVGFIRDVLLWVLDEEQHKQMTLMLNKLKELVSVGSITPEDLD